MCQDRLAWALSRSAQTHVTAGQSFKPLTLLCRGAAPEVVELQCLLNAGMVSLLALDVGHAEQQAASVPAKTQHLPHPAALASPTRLQGALPFIPESPPVGVQGQGVLQAGHAMAGPVHLDRPMLPAAGSVDAQQQLPAAALGVPGLATGGVAAGIQQQQAAAVEVSPPPEAGTSAGQAEAARRAPAGSSPPVAAWPVPGMELRSAAGDAAGEPLSRQGSRQPISPEKALPPGRAAVLAAAYATLGRCDAFHRSRPKFSAAASQQLGLPQEIRQEGAMGQLLIRYGQYLRVPGAGGTAAHSRVCLHAWTVSACHIVQSSLLGNALTNGWLCVRSSP